MLGSNGTVPRTSPNDMGLIMHPTHKPDVKTEAKQMAKPREELVEKG